MELPFIIDEPEKILNSSTMTLDKWKSLKDSVVIDKK